MSNTKHSFPAKSMVYIVIFEHLKGGLVRKGNFSIQLTGKQKVDDFSDIQAFENVLQGKGFVDPVVIDWKELGLQKTITPENHKSSGK